MITGPGVVAGLDFSLVAFVLVRVGWDRDAQPLETNQVKPARPIEEAGQAGGHLEVPDVDERIALVVPLHPDCESVARDAQCWKRAGVQVLQLDVGVELVLECLHELFSKHRAA